MNTLKNITLTKEGKKEAIDEGLIYTVSEFLCSSIDNERLFSSSFMMSIAISLEAKKQVCNYCLNGKFEILEVEHINIETMCIIVGSEFRYKE